jgi:hypothetical protein
MLKQFTIRLILLNVHGIYCEFNLWPLLVNIYICQRLLYFVYFSGICRDGICLNFCQIEGKEPCICSPGNNRTGSLFFNLLALGDCLFFCIEVKDFKNVNHRQEKWQIRCVVAWLCKIYIGGVMVSVLAASVVDCGFEPRSGQTKDYKIGICCISTKQH